MKFSEKIIQARKAKALTQEDLAEAVGVSRQAVSKWETEEAKPDLDKLVALCTVLDMSMDYLCLDKEPEQTAEPAPSAPVKNNNLRYLLAGVCIGFVAAILIGLLALGLHKGFAQPQTPSTSTMPTDGKTLISLVKILDANFLHEGSTEDQNLIKLTFIPTLEIPNVQVQVAVHDNTKGSTQYLDVENIENVYSLEYTTDDTCNLNFYAVFTLEDITVDVPLFWYTHNGRFWTLINSWEKT